MAPAQARRTCQAVPGLSEVRTGGPGLLGNENRGRRMLLYKTGRFLQVVGMIVVPVGIAGNMADPQRISLGLSLGIAAAGMVIFGLGYWLQQMGKPE